MLASPTQARAAPSPGQRVGGAGGNFGLGITSGSPTGASAKLFMHPRHALQFELGWAPWHFGDGRATVDYLFTVGSFWDHRILEMIGYIGIGGGVGFWSGRARCCGIPGPGPGPDPDPDIDRRRGDRRHRGAGLLLRAPILGFGVHWKKVPFDSVIESAWAPYLIPFEVNHFDIALKGRYYF